MANLVIGNDDLESANKGRLWGETKLAEAYIHLKPFEPKSFPELEKYLKQTAYGIAKDIYPSIEPNISVEFEEGSLKTWITIGGILIAAISHYGSFRSGIDHLVKDGRAACEMIIPKAVQIVNADPQQIYRTERRSGVPGQLQRVLRDLDYLNENMSHMKNTEISQRLHAISGHLRRISANIANEEDMAFILKHLNTDHSFLNLSKEDRNKMLDEMQKNSCLHCVPKIRGEMRSQKKKKLRQIAQ